VPYISDYHGISVVGRASLIGALLGEDLFHRRAFLLDLLFYLAAFAVAWLGLRRRRPPSAYPGAEGGGEPGTKST
jgi:hypothetical protein